MEIATIILNQLKTNRNELWAWGSKDFLSLNRNVEDNTYPSLMFSIKTPKVKKGGRVVISLNEGQDTYIVEAFTLRGGKEKSLGIVKDVYCDMLHSTINSLIEDEETYYNI